MAINSSVSHDERARYIDVGTASPVEDNSSRAQYLKLDQIPVDQLKDLVKQIKTLASTMSVNDLLIPVYGQNGTLLGEIPAISLLNEDLVQTRLADEES